ncbi:MAG: hypothetical protein OXC62_15440 [Aestuariivita sp.]|nr:hypothetical protein [Aestuariivita sp.]
MNDEPDLHELAKQFAVLEERMKTKHAETETVLERLNAAFERLRADIEVKMSSMKEDAAKRDTDNIKQMTDIKERLSKRDTEFAKFETRMIFLTIATISAATAIIAVMINM